MTDQRNSTGSDGAAATPDQHRARVIALALVGCLATGALGAAIVITRERTVSGAERRLEEQSRAIDSGEMPAAVSLPIEGAGYPARARIADALLLARRAAPLAPSPVRRSLLARAAQDIAAVTNARPDWGEAWAVCAYVAALRGGAGSPQARRALVRSYDDAPFLRHSAAWRTRLGFALWPVLGESTRERLVNEAVWLARIDLSMREQIFVSARESPGYDAFLSQWRWLRDRDADYRSSHGQSAAGAYTSPEQPGSIRTSATIHPGAGPPDRQSGSFELALSPHTVRA